MYHVLNRGNNRAVLFDKPEDYQAFERILEEACLGFNMRLLAYAGMVAADRSCLRRRSWLPDPSGEPGRNDAVTYIDAKAAFL